MDSTSSHTLTLKQKALLAAGVFAIYWPIRIYYNINEWDWSFVQGAWGLWLIEIPLTILFFIGWLSVTEWLEEKLFNRSGREFLINMNWSAQLATLLVAVTLALVFNTVFHAITHQIYGHVARQEIRQKLGEVPEPRREPRSPMRPDRRQKANNGLTIMAMLMAYYLAANRRGYSQLALLRIQAEELGKEAAQAQFMALRNQVNPHFLFNSLSILSSLVEVDPKLSVQFINRLSKAYRYILEQRDAERLPLRTELDFIESYTFLLRIRFDERLQVHINVPDADRDRYQIAPLTLQLLVENAVKHNRMSDEEPLIVTIDIEDDYLRIMNRLQPRPRMEESTGVGLTNIVNRYRLLTSKPVWVGESEGAFVIKIPLLKSEKENA
ncbi:histidine kinase [Spirosoma sp. SC4-14]|uniref:sensor histidine kinase n=1 Tax=Spirosoma sp. SC4-14 TaxID=3128900 RepID=UPI0030CDD41B